MDKHSKNRQALVDTIGKGATLIVPGAHDPISAKLIERHRFPAVYVGSYATSAARLGLPDVGLVSMNEMVRRGRSEQQLRLDKTRTFSSLRGPTRYG